MPQSDASAPVTQESRSPSSSSRPSTTLKRSKKESSLIRIARLIRRGKVKRIVVLTGAGISTSAGIPDFRSPETGLYANLARLNLPFPEAVFELGYFQKNPVPFWTLAKDLYPGKYLPTPTHYFLTLLHRHSLLKRVFSQNIDTLESLAGLPASHIIEAHGSFAKSHCLACRRAASREYVLKAGVREGKVVKCEHCGGLVKPDIVFFGEGLPERFFQNIKDMKEADLLIIIGTSLQVHPFASLPDYCRDGIPRLLINREAVGDFARLRSSRSKGGGGATGLAALMKELGLDMKGNVLPETDESDEDEDEDEEEEEQKDDDEDDTDDIGDVFWQGDADDGVRRLAQELGWEEELDGLIRSGNEALKRSWAEGTPEDSAVRSNLPAESDREVIVRKDKDEERKAAPTAAGQASRLAEEIAARIPEATAQTRVDDDDKIPADERDIMNQFLVQERARASQRKAESPNEAD